MWLLIACAAPEPRVEPDSAAPWPCEGEPVVTWASWGQGFSRAYCDACHAADTPDRRGAPEAVTLDSLEDWRTHAERVRVRTLEDADMPPGGGVTNEDLVSLDILLRCGL